MAINSKFYQDAPDKRSLYKTAYWRNGNLFVRLEQWNPITHEYHVSWHIPGDRVKRFCWLMSEELSDFVL